MAAIEAHLWPRARGVHWSSSCMELLQLTQLYPTHPSALPQVDCGIYRRRKLQQTRRPPPPRPRPPPPRLRPPPPRRSPPPRPRPPPSSAAPAAWDWRTRGVVSPVLSQGYCASCYAFAAAAAIESAVAIFKKTAVPTVSPQPWVDCFWDFYGCGECTVHIAAWVACLGMRARALLYFH